MKTQRASVLLSLPLALVVAGAAPAPALDCVVYELAAGSELIDECVVCGRPPAITTITGSFVLRQLPVPAPADVYAVLDIDFHPAAAETPAIYGTGQFQRIAGQSSLVLDVDVAGTSGVHLESALSAETVGWPAIDLIAREDGSRDPFHAYRIHIIAAPSTKTVLYQLQPGEVVDQSGSFLVDDCLGCESPARMVPMQGSFLLETVSEGPDPFVRHKVYCLDLRSAAEDAHYDVLGSGTYDEGGEVALQQNMILQVSVNAEPEIRMLGGGPFPEGVSFPTIDIQLSQNDPPPPPVLHFYTLHIVAHPVIVDGVPFRRGDANADGQLDVSDGIFFLLWRFSGGREPPCLDAADANGDDDHSLTDAVFVLNFLFAGGDTPPQPGPRECGLGQGPSLGCTAYPCGP